MEKLIGTEQVLKMVGMTYQGVRKAILEGRFPEPVKICGRLRWDKSWIDAYLATGENMRPYTEPQQQAITAAGVEGWGGESELVKLHARQLTMRHLDLIAGIRNRLDEANKMMDELASSLLIDGRDNLEAEIDDKFAAEDEELLKGLENKE